MKIVTKFVLLLAFCCVSLLLNAQSPIGIWKTVDDETGKAKSHVKIFEKDGRLYGEIVKIIDPTKQDAICSKCGGDRKNKPVMGLEILRKLKKKGNYWGAGTIVDPNNGKVYDCYVELVNDDKLKVRGFLGIAALGRTQYWYRVD